MLHMDLFNFNKIYVIESLKGEWLTGEELYNDIIKRRHNNSTLLQVHSRDEWECAIATIMNEVSAMGIIPILHLELHGSSKGLSLSSGELIAWDDFVNRMREINVSTENNLFITMGICFGANILLHTQFDKPAPFFCFIGSFHEMYEEDIRIRYSEFYNEFLQSHNITQSLELLYKANPECPNVYSFVNAPEIFRRVYEKYLNTQFTEEALTKRTEQSLDSRGVSRSSKDRAQLEARLKQELKNSKDQFFIKHINCFLMTDRFESCRKRFTIPEKIDNFASFLEDRTIMPNIIL